MTRRQWLRMAAVLPTYPALGARKEFWEAKDPANWTSEEKEILLNQSPWAREGLARMDLNPRRTPPANTGRPGVDMPDVRPGTPPMGTPSVPIGEPLPPRPPSADPGRPVQFRVLARWESARPVHLAGGPESPDLAGKFYVIRLRGLPLMPPPKVKPGEAPVNPNEGILQAVKQGSYLERKGKAAIPCDHLFTGSGDSANEVLLFFPHGSDPITVADRLVTLESSFTLFHLSIKFPLKEMMYRDELAL